MTTISVRKAAARDLHALTKNLSLYKRIHAIIFDEMPVSSDIFFDFDVKPLKGAANAFRVRIQDHRIAFSREADGSIVIHRILHRSVVYRYFP
jgi:mRNA-degrading endonuclease RelE of RelBE toxin-antitoxin system